MAKYVMKARYFYSIFFPICLLVNLSVNAQTQELQTSFNNIISIFKEYDVETPEVWGSRCPDPMLVAKNLDLSFKYPYMTISYTLAYAPEVSYVVGHKPGKRTIIFSINDTKISEGYKSYKSQKIYFYSELGIEKIALGKKDLLDNWELSMSPLVCQRLCREFLQFKFLVNKTEFKGSVGKLQVANSNTKQLNRVVIKLKKESSGVYTVPCKVNGLFLKFIFDTGASAISLSKSEAVFMLKNGYLSADDIVGSQQFKTASGDIMEGTKIFIRKIEIGGLILRNVEASVVHNNNAPLLLGQSALSRLGRIEIDYNTSTLTIIR